MKYLLFILIMFSATYAGADYDIEGSTVTEKEKLEAELDEVRAEIDYTENNRKDIALARVERLQKSLGRYEGKPRRQASEGNVTMREHLESLLEREVMPGNHIVEKDDTLTKISNKYGTDNETVLKVNPQIEDPDMIHIGERVRILNHNYPNRRLMRLRDREADIEKQLEELDE